MNRILEQKILSLLSKFELRKSIDVDNKYGSNFYVSLSTDLKKELPGVQGLSPATIRYTKRFFLLYNQSIGNLQQVAEQLEKEIFPIPWGHHILLIDKCSMDMIR